MQRLSVIVRFHNEARYLGTVLHAVREQHCDLPVEVVAINNSSTDDSLSIANRYADVVLDIDEYRPGAALNRAIECCSGDALVILSAHAIPANRSWLENLTSWVPNSGVLGTYGAQLYPVTSLFLDKRDLDIFSDLRPRIEVRDSDFWSANSTFPRSSWKKGRFDETVFELEDHHWTKKLLPQGDQWVRFEPTALVYHYGHAARNDREFLPPSKLSDVERIEVATGVLWSGTESWPDVMSAGLTLASLAHLPEAVRAVPALGRTLLEHEDFDVRWRMAGALGRIGSPAAARFLVQGLLDPSFYARDECAWALARLGDVGVAALLPVVDTLDPQARPFAALALGLSGNRDAGQRALHLLGEDLSVGTPDLVRDALYFLGEVACRTMAHDLTEAVAGLLRSDDDLVLRAAAWCFGALAKAGAAYPAGTRDLVDLALRHPLETVRFEAVTALAKAATARRASPLVSEIVRALREDGAGRVRYGAMQNLRLMSAHGLDRSAEALAHDSDPDFGVLFERELLQEATR